MANKRRQQRIGDSIQREVSKAILYRVKDPRLIGVTITDADITADLSISTVWFSVLGDEEERWTEAEEGLASALGFLRREMGASLGLRHTPELNFKRDKSFERGQRIDAILDRIADEGGESDE
jgi:ribosome-binding factor A